MSEVNTPIANASAAIEPAKVSLIDIMIALARHKRLIVVLPILAALTSAAVSFALPNIYRASTKLMPPQQSQSGASALLSQLGGAAGIAAGMAGIKNPNELYVSMLKSRTIADRLINQFALTKIYETASIEKTRRILEENSIISSGKDGLITIEVEDKDRRLAAALANSYVSELLRLTSVIAVSEASQRRLFFERQLNISKSNLAKAEAALKGGLDVNGVISVDSESRAVVETVARLRAQVSAKTIELNSMAAFVTSDHPKYRQATQELNSLRAELSKLENGSSQEDKVRQKSTDKSTDSSGGLKNIQLLRDIRYNQMLYEMLSKQYEVARLEEAKEPSIVQVLDTAVEPELKFKPKRSMIVLTSTIGALLIAILWAFISESTQRALLFPSFAVKWDELKKLLLKK